MEQSYLCLCFLLCHSFLRIINLEVRLDLSLERKI